MVSVVQTSLKHIFSLKKKKAAITHFTVINFACLCWNNITAGTNSPTDNSNNVRARLPELA